MCSGAVPGAGLSPGSPFGAGRAGLRNAGGFGGQRGDDRPSITARLSAAAARGATFPASPACHPGIPGGGGASSRCTGGRRGMPGGGEPRPGSLPVPRWRRTIPAIPTGSSAALAGGSSASANLIIVTNELRHGFISSLIKRLC